jgi:integral membrane protein (TIGR01906 family)
MKNPLFVLFIIILSFILFFVPFRVLIFNQSFYFYEQNKTGVFQAMNQSEAQNLTLEVINYLHKGYDLENFTAREITHLHDVKYLIDIDLILGSICILLFVIFCYFNYKDKRFPDIFIYSGAAVILLLALLFFMILINFDFFFRLFHVALFEPGTWVFDPDIEVIKQLFPNKFFSDFVLINVMITLVLSLAAIIFSFIYKKAFKHSPIRKKK